MPALRGAFAWVWVGAATIAGELVPKAVPPIDWLPRERLSSGALWLLEMPKAPPALSIRPQSEPAVAPPSSARAPDFVGENLRLGEDPPELAPERRAQAEPHAARSFSDPGLILATFQEGRFEDGGAVGCGYAVTRDGGVTWERRWIPGLVQTVDEGLFDRASDPVAAVGPDGALWLNTLGLKTTPDGFVTSIALSRSTDGGRTFSPPILAAESTDVDNFLDKNWMAVNSFPGTPTTGRLVITLTHFRTLPNRSVIYPVVLTYSDDHGASWSERQTITPNYCQGSQPVFLPDGALAVGYWNFNNPNRDRIEVVVSEDGGDTFGSANVVAEVTIHEDPIARSAEFLPTLAADRTLGHLYLAWQARDGVPRILFARSTDRGHSWSPAVPVNDTPAGRSVFNPALAVSPDGQHVTVVFYDKRHDLGAGNWVDLYLAESFDGGLTWEPNTRISTTSSDLSRAPLTSAGRMLGDYQGLVPSLTLQSPGLAVWVDTRGGSPDPFGAIIRRRVGPSFANWQRLLFAGAVDEGRPAGDPDGDRLQNLLEYLLGTDPLKGTASPLVPVIDPTDKRLVAWRFDVLADVQDSQPAALESTDLSVWTTVTPEAEADASIEVHRRRFALKPSPSAPPFTFHRLGAEPVPP